MDIRIAKGYELKYWNAHKKEPYFRSDKMLKLFNTNLFSNSNQVVADVGCGPSGSLKNSILNIMSNIKSNGLFCLHVHMRTKK